MTVSYSFWEIWGNVLIGQVRIFGARVCGFFFCKSKWKRIFFFYQKKSRIPRFHFVKERQNVQSQGNVYCYYNNVLLVPSPESPDDFATDVLLIIDWSMDIYDFCFDWSIGRMRTPVREAFSYWVRHEIRHTHCDSMKHKVILHWITMNMPYPVPYLVRKCLPYGTTHRPISSMDIAVVSLSHWMA